MTAPSPSAPGLLCWAECGGPLAQALSSPWGPSPGGQSEAAAAPKRPSCFSFRTIDSLYEELVFQGIIKKSSKVQLADYSGRWPSPSLSWSEVPHPVVENLGRKQPIQFSRSVADKSRGCGTWVTWPHSPRFSSSVWFSCPLGAWGFMGASLMSVHGRNWSASWPDVVPLANASLEMPLPLPVLDVCLLGLFGGLGSDIWGCWLSIKHTFHGGVLVNSHPSSHHSTARILLVTQTGTGAQMVEKPPSSCSPPPVEPPGLSFKCQLQPRHVPLKVGMRAQAAPSSLLTNRRLC